MNLGHPIEIAATFNNAYTFSDRRDELTKGARAVIAAWKGPGALMIVTHGANILPLTGFQPAEGEMIVVEPEAMADGRLRVIGRIPVGTLKETTMHDDQTRRRFLVSGAAAATGLTLALPDLAVGQQLPPRPNARGASEVTIRQTEGPFFKPSSPQRSDLREPGLNGELFVVSGLVLTRGCKPVANALVDLWHADGKGDYDNSGFRGRGHQFTDGEGRYSFVTVKPARYPGRTPHYHVKVQAANRPVLTTQLYFPDDPGNARDPIFRRELLMRLLGGRTPPGRASISCSTSPEVCSISLASGRPAFASADRHLRMRRATGDTR